MKKLLRWIHRFAGCPAVQVMLVIAVGVLAVAPPPFLLHSPDSRNLWLAFLALLFSLSTWLFVAVKQWPYMQVDGISGDGNCLMRVSLDGAFYVFARFRFLNKSHQTNVVLNSHYSLQINGHATWYPVTPTITPDDLENGVQEQRKKNPSLFLSTPEVYLPNTAHTRCVAFCCTVPLRVDGTAPPEGRLKARFELAEGGPEEAIVDLKSSGGVPKFEKVSSF